MIAKPKIADFLNNFAVLLYLTTEALSKEDDAGSLGVSGRNIFCSTNSANKIILNNFLEVFRDT